MALTPLHVKDVCNSAASSQWGWGDPNNVCKYLSYEIVGKNYVSMCLKKAPGIVADKIAKGQLPINFDKLKDNCPGYIYLKHKSQGYDV